MSWARRTILELRREKYACDAQRSIRTNTQARE
jgi:hypothetical protein